MALTSADARAVKTAASRDGQKDRTAVGTRAVETVAMSVNLQEYELAGLSVATKGAAKAAQMDRVTDRSWAAKKGEQTAATTVAKAVHPTVAPKVVVWAVSWVEREAGEWAA